MTMPPVPENRVIRDGLSPGFFVAAFGAMVLIGAAAVVVILLGAIERPTPAPLVGVSSPSLTVEPGKPSPFTFRAYDPSAEWMRWTPTTRTLLITEHAPGDLLICFKDEDHCKLIRDWNPR